MYKFFKRLSPAFIFTVASLTLLNYIDKGSKTEITNLPISNTPIKDNANSSIITSDSNNQALSPSTSNTKTSLSGNETSLPLNSNLQSNSPSALPINTPTQTKNNKRTSPTTSPTPNPSKTVNPTPTPNKTVNPTPTPIKTVPPTIPSPQIIKGDPIDTRYGVVQVQITIINGHLNNVNMLSAPTGRSAQFTQYATPILISQSIKSQSANIDGASGATYTSEGFINSLQSALNKVIK